MSAAQYEIKDLLRRIAENDEASFRILFDQYKDRFYAVALKMTGTTVVAEEMVQDIFLKVWQNRAILTDINNPDSYFFTILYRQIFRHYKKIALDRKLLQLIAESSSFQNITDETILAQETERLIHEAVNKLPPQQGLVFKMSKLDGLTREQIAEQLQISPNTVRNHLADAVKFIRVYMNRAAFLFASLIFTLMR